MSYDPTAINVRIETEPTDKKLGCQVKTKNEKLTLADLINEVVNVLMAMDAKVDQINFTKGIVLQLNMTTEREKYTIKFCSPAMYQHAEKVVLSWMKGNGGR